MISQLSRFDRPNFEVPIHYMFQKRYYEEKERNREEEKKRRDREHHEEKKRRYYEEKKRRERATAGPSHVSDKLNSKYEPPSNYIIAQNLPSLERTVLDE